MTTERRVEWKWGALAALALVVVTLYPQINLWLARGKQWHGSYVMTQGDEVMYSAYANALIDGRPRKNDPFNGQDDAPGRPAYESLNSIHFVPAYLVALPARALGLNASTAFIVLLVFAALASSLAIFWLLATLTGHSKFAAVGTLVTLSFGALAGSNCCWHANAFTEMIPFLRRYHPAASFPLFFVFSGFIWRAVTREKSKARLIYSVAAGAALVVMVFSYFYIWTAAAAWFACVALLWILFRRDQFRRIALTAIIVGAFALAAVAGFLTMLKNRNPVLDQGQLLVSSHAPDLFNQPEIIAFIAFAALALAAWRKRVDVRSPLVLFALSFTLMTFVVFNQQILTGMSVQPIHYKVFIANYAALISVVLAFAILWRARYAQRAIPSLALIIAAVVSVGWLTFEVYRATEHWAQKEKLRDDLFAVSQRLTAMATEDGSLAAARAGQTTYPTVFTLAVDETLEVSMSIPSYSPMAVLWSLHSDAYITPFESKGRYYRHLYYAGLTPKMVGIKMRENVFWILVPLFGSERVVPGLVNDFKPITLDDIQEERHRYDEFYKAFTYQVAASPRLNFVVVPNGFDLPNFANLDRWYERDAGEKVGAFTIYRVKLRPETHEFLFD
jgi:hypothetical protein